MNKALKRFLIIIGSLLLVGFIAFFLMKQYTKSFSPEETIEYRKDDLKVSVFYNRPWKKGRKVFDSLVPYGEVWRTGANEATTFKTNQDIYVDGSLLKAGKYTLWTIPKEKSWEIIFNSKMYSWGIDLEGNPSREPEFDVLKLEVPVLKNYKTIEQFSIYFEEKAPLNFMYLAWENVVVAIPFKKAK